MTSGTVRALTLGKLSYLTSLLERKRLAMSVLSAKFTFCGMSPVCSMTCTALRSRIALLGSLPELGIRGLMFTSTNRCHPVFLIIGKRKCRYQHQAGNGTAKDVKQATHHRSSNNPI
jgi:hypothetical protein